EGEGEGEETRLAILHFKDDLDTLYKTAHFNLSVRPDAMEEVAEKFRNLLCYAWSAGAPLDPSTAQSQPLPTREASQNEDGSTPPSLASLKRSATSPTGNAAATVIAKMAKMSDVSSRMAGGGDRGGSSEECGSRSDVKSVEEYRKVAKFFEEVASTVYRMDQPKRARLMRLITDIIELTAQEN
ncbi:hypothetical protein PENTCL1PPCAC_12003, partial [Pristionchus entomophagus]